MRHSVSFHFCFTQLNRKHIYTSWANEVHTLSCVCYGKICVKLVLVCVNESDGLFIRFVYLETWPLPNFAVCHKARLLHWKRNHLPNSCSPNTVLVGSTDEHCNGRSIFW